MIKLYDFPLSGHSHRVRLMLSLLNIEYENIFVDLAKGEHKQAAFTDLTAFGQVPVLIDGDLILRDSNAIITYLASKYGPEWYSSNPDSIGEIQQWLSTATRDIATGPAAARLVTVFGAQLDHQALIEQSHTLLKRIDAHLKHREWLAVDRPTIADVSAYSYIAHAPEGHVSLHPYPHIQAWLARIEALPGFVAMPKTDVAPAA